MKKIILFSLTFLMLSFTSFPVNQPQNKEYVVIRIDYSSKKAGIIPSIFLDFGTDKSHKMFGKVENTESGGLKFIMPDGNVKIAVSETEVLNCFSAYGYTLDHVYSVNVLSHDYIHLILVKGE